MPKSLEQEYREEGVQMGLRGEDEVSFITSIRDHLTSPESCIQAREEDIREGLAARTIAQGVKTST